MRSTHLLHPLLAGAVAAAAALITSGSEAAIGRPEPTPQASVKRADFGRERPSRDAAQVANAIVASGDNDGAPFIILDKVAARVYVFEPAGRLRAAAPALLGLARGDDTVPGIGDRKIADIKPEERTTPAGRFVAEFGRSSSRGEDVVWVDYDAAVSMHRVVTSNPKERRLQRLATRSVRDNRISYGCINLPKAFYEAWVGPTVAQSTTIVYVLPEAHSLRETFSFLDGKRRLARQAATKSLRAGPPEGMPMPLIDQ
ncbi:MAG TPA: L,D-transpeptidase [Albitalea sp.]|jgi:hypothetical protein|nr:L,D-transpeptidase [Albitalea sp.]